MSQGIRPIHYFGLPLLARAWAFQERMLSPRVIHFGETELIWECRKGTFCECGHVKHMGKEELHAVFNETTSRNFVGLWHNLVQTYCLLDMTFESDKLPAFSGLASKMAKMSHTRNI